MQYIQSSWCANDDEKKQNTHHLREIRSVFAGPKKWATKCEISDGINLF